RYSAGHVCPDEISRHLVEESVCRPHAYAGGQVPRNHVARLPAPANDVAGPHDKYAILAIGLRDGAGEVHSNVAILNYSPERAKGVVEEYAVGRETINYKPANCATTGGYDQTGGNSLIAVQFNPRPAEALHAPLGETVDKYLVRNCRQRSVERDSGRRSL